MHDISKIILILSKEEKQEFIAVLKQKNKRNDSKNIQLFKLLDTSHVIDNPDHILYGKSSKGAYHALCKRLQDSLIDFIATKNLEGETSDQLAILKLLMASRILFEHKQFKIAFKTLRKAEQKAKYHDSYSILNEIYYTQIQYAHLDNTIILDHLILQFKDNKKALHQEEQLNLFYAKLQEQLRIPDQDIHHTINRALKDFDLIIDKDLTYRSLYKILEITSNTAHLTRNYHQVFPFIMATYTQLSLKNDPKDHQLFYHIQILYYVANANFRNRAYNTAQYYLDEVLSYIKLQQKKYYTHFYPQYVLLQSLIFNYTNQPQLAIQLLEDFPYAKYKNQTAYVLDLRLVFIVFLSQQLEIKKAYRLFTTFIHSDTWYLKKTDLSWVIQKNLVEILLHIELEHIDLVSSRLQSFKRKYTPYLKKNKEYHILDFIKLISLYHQKGVSSDSTVLINKFESTLSQLNLTTTDVFIISFFAWLKAKITKQDVYKTILKLTSFNTES
ncbi:hypothetical protein [Aquimarina rhabdastrellae]